MDRIQGNVNVNRERLTVEIERKGVSPAEVSRLAVGHADAVRNILRSPSGSARISTAMALAETLDVDYEYLTDQQDQRRRAETAGRIPNAAFRLTDEEIQLIGLCRSAPQEMPRILAIVRGLLANGA